jgi:hypothetical protein
MLDRARLCAYVIVEGDIRENSPGIYHWTD